MGTYHVLLQIRWLAIEHVYRLDAIVNHTKGAVKEAKQVTGYFSRIGHHLLSIRLTHRNEKLVQTHGGIDGDFSAEQGLDIKLLDTGRRLIGQQRR